MIFLSIFGTLIGYSFACLGMGRLVSAVFIKGSALNFSSAGTELAAVFLLGQGMLANTWLMLALSGRFDPVVITFTIILLAIAGMVQGYGSFRTLGHEVRDFFVELKSDGWPWKILTFLAGILCLAWITSLGRSPWGDGSLFYLALAKIISSSHRLMPLPGYDEFTSVGLQGELHYAALMTLNSPGAAQLFAWPAIMAGTTMLLVLAQEAGVGRHGRLFVFLMVFTSTAVITLSGDGKTDLFSAAFGFSAYYWAAKIRSTGNVAVFGLTGLFTGLAIVAKMSYIIVLPPSLAILFFWSYTAGRQQQGEARTGTTPFFIGTTWMLAGMIIAVAPHFIKNALLFDNPFAPFGMGAEGWQNQSWYGPETTKRLILTYPLALTFGKYWSQMGNISPLVLTLLPLGFLLPRSMRHPNSLIGIITISAVAGMVCWCVLRPSIAAPRYYLACLLLLTIPAGKIAEYLVSNNVKSRLLSTSLLAGTFIVAISTGLSSLDRSFFPGSTLAYLTGRMTECEKEPTYCEFMTLINDSVPTGSRLFTHTPHRYWYRPDLIQCSLTDHEFEAYKDLDTPGQRWSFIYGRGFRYIPLYEEYWGEIKIIVTQDLADIPGWLDVEKISTREGQLLLLNSIDTIHEPQVVCTQNEYAWSLADK